MKIRLNDLKNFIEVAACHTMREGAERLHITQPALSESIKRLENDVGEKLFYRSKYGVALTPSGLEIADKSRSVINILCEITGDEKSTSKRLVTIGCHETVGSYFLPKFFIGMDKQSSLRIRLKHGLSRFVQVEVQHGRIDVGIVVNPVASPDLIIRTLASDEFCIWQGTDLKTQNLKLFCNLEMNQTHSLIKKWRHKPFEIIESSNLELIARMVNANLGYGILPKRIITLLEFKHMIQVPNSPIYKDSIALVYRPEFGKNDSEKELLDLLRSSLK